MTFRKLWICGLIFSLQAAPVGGYEKDFCANQPCRQSCPRAKPQGAAKKAPTPGLRRNIAGVVIDMAGKWNLCAGAQVRALKKGDAVQDGWSLKALEKEAAVKVLLADGTTLSCPGGTGCELPISINKNKSTAQNWLSAAIGMFVRKPDQWVVLQSRAGNDLNPQDGVLKAVGGCLDLSPVCRGIADGNYYLRIRSSGGPAGRRLGPERITVAGGKPVFVSAPDLTPGLYIVNISASKEEEPSIYNQSWVLLSDGKRYERRLDKYQQAVRASGSLSADVPAARVRELLQAYIASLAEETQ